MKYFKMCCPLFLLLLAGVCLCAQDKIYYAKDKIDNWKVTAISAGYLKGTDIKNPEIDHSASQKNVLFIFNNKGNFLVIPELYDSPEKSRLYTTHFLQYSSRDFQQTDRIITAKNNIIRCKIELEKEQGIVYAIGNKEFLLPKTEIAVIIYKDGTHKLMTTAEKACKILKSVQDEYNLAFSISPAETNGSSTLKDAGTEQQVMLKKESKQSNTVKNENTASLQAQAEAFVGNSAKTFSKDKTSVDSQSTKPVPVRSNNNTVETSKGLDASTISSLQEKAVLNIKELESYIQLIADKQSNPDKVTKAVEQAVSLFASEDSRIEVSSVNRTEAQQFKVRLYLNRLGLMKYSKIVVDWYNVQYASKIRRNPDGTYSGFIEFEQRFTGISGDKKTYQDVTRKTIEIILKSSYKKSGGQDILVWDVFLGNIGITVTKAA